MIGINDLETIDQHAFDWDSFQTHSGTLQCPRAMEIHAAWDISSSYREPFFAKNCSILAALSTYIYGPDRELNEVNGLSAQHTQDEENIDSKQDPAHAGIIISPLPPASIAATAT